MIENDEGTMIVTDYRQYKIVSFNNLKYNQLDLYSIHDLAEIFKKGNSEGVLDWVLDLSTISHMDSSGFGGLAHQAHYLSKNSKRLFLLNPNNSVKHLFSITGFDRIFAVITDKSSLP